MDSGKYSLEQYTGEYKCLSCNARRDIEDEHKRIAYSYCRVCEEVMRFQKR